MERIFCWNQKASYCHLNELPEAEKSLKYGQTPEAHHPNPPQCHIRPQIHDREDVARMDALGIENIVFHPGSHTGIGAKAGIVNIIAGLDQAITGQENLMILLETMSGNLL